MDALRMFFVILALLAIFPSIVQSLDVNINVRGIIDWNIGWVDVINGSFQALNFHIENIGSVDCDTLLRVDYYNKSDLLYTGWSEMDVLSPGEYKSFVIYSSLPYGNYTANLTMFYCKNVYTLGSYNIFSTNRIKNNLNKNKFIVELIESVAKENKIEVAIRSKEDVENVIVIPERYPLGWVVSSKRVRSIPKGEGKVAIYYDAPVLRGKNITFAVYTEDGKLIGYNTLLVKKESKKSNNTVALVALLSIFGFVLITAIYLFYKKIRYIWKK